VHEQRKADHIRINLEEPVEFPSLTTGLHRFRFIHQALPEIDRDAIDLSIAFLGKKLAAPLVISSMTGGTEQAAAINRHLAQAAQAAGIAMGLGSQRAALEDEQLLPTYQVRALAPDILLFANLGAVQLNYGYTVDHCLRAVEMVEADALILHLNPLQEALQLHGDTAWSGLLRRIEEVCARLPAPVVVKEVGWGLSGQVARQLLAAGVAALDVAGAGGTSWSEVEAHRAESAAARRIARDFADWGIPTADSILMVREVAPDVPLIASGGIYTGIDVAKCIALGADVAALARPFLKAATISTEAVVEKAWEITEELRTALFCLGMPDIAGLKNTPLLRRVE
jgi:isopentenyl-diphosphate delta-isomerase